MKKYLLLLGLICLTGCSSIDKEKYVIIQKNQIPYYVKDLDLLITYMEKDPYVIQRDRQPIRCRKDELLSKLQQKE